MADGKCKLPLTVKCTPISEILKCEKMCILESIKCELSHIASIAEVGYLLIAHQGPRLFLFHYS